MTEPLFPLLGGNPSTQLRVRVNALASTEDCHQRERLDREGYQVDLGTTIGCPWGQAPALSGAQDASSFAADSRFGHKRQVRIWGWGYFESKLKCPH